MPQNFFNAAVNNVAKVLEQLMMVLVVAMMLALFWQVFTRFVIKVPSTWTEEIARYTFIYMVMIGAALGVKHSAHFGVTMLSDKLHGRARDIYQRFVINGIILVCAGFLFYYGFEFTRLYGLNRVSPTLKTGGRPTRNWRRPGPRRGDPRHLDHRFRPRWAP